MSTNTPITSPTTSASPPDLDTYRRHARAWLEANLEPADPNAGVRRTRDGRHRTRDDFVAERALQRRLYEAGYAGITWPSEYGGQGLTAEHERAFNEEAAHFRMPDLGHAAGITFGICGQTMLRYGSPSFLARHVPRMLAGEELFVQLFSEPGAGSDMAGVTTRATRDGDQWIITGAKIWTSGADSADYGMCLARTDWDVPKHRGLSWFAVPLDAPGVTMEPIREINGDADFCQEFLDDVVIDADEVIGEVNDGWAIAQTMLVLERSAGRGDKRVEPEIEAGFDPHVVEVARRAGRLDDPVARQLMAQIHTLDWVRVQLSTRIGQLMTTSERPPMGIAAYWKLAAGVIDPQKARWVFELGQGLPIAWREDDEEARLPSLNHLNSRVFSIAGGSNEMQRNAIGERVLDLPREPSFDTDRPFNEVLRNAKWR
jgi:alkylation response protein AidB-like acyl-CoA dehydrogenase